MVKRKSKFDYFFVLRPMLFIPGWSTLLAGYLIETRRDIFLSADEIMTFNYFHLFLAMMAFGMAMGVSFLLNQMCDIESDRANKKLFFFANGIISKKEVIIESVVLVFLSLVVSIEVGVSVFLLTALFLVLTGYLYNYHPFAMKDKPMPSLIANMLMGVLAFALGWMVRVGEPQWGFINDVLPYLFLNTSLYFFTTLPDVNGDASINKKTFAVQIGVRRVIIMGLICFGLSVLFTFKNQDYFLGFILILSAPQFIRLVFAQEVKYAIKATKYTILFFSIAISIKIPFFVFVISGIILLTKWYYKRRFNFDYPNIKGV